MQKIADLISEDITGRISEKLNEIEKSSNLSNLDVSTILDKIHVLTTKEYLSIQNDLWKDIAKLSIDFYLDFDYYKQFTFQSKFSCKEYHDSLKTLGFKEINGFWKSYSKPSKTLVINYVVQSCIYRTIMMKMNEGDSPDANLNEVITTNDTIEFKDCCPFCDKNLNGVHNCESCGATAEEIENLRNQNKQIENKHNQLDNDESVAEDTGVVENDVLSSEHVDSVNYTGNSLINSNNNTNENTLIINENSKSISNINFSERNKQKINRGNEIGGENVDIERRFPIANVASIGGNSNKMRSKHKKPNISSRNYTFNENVMKINNNNNNIKKDDSQIADEHGEDHLDWTKWKCKKCGLVNEDENVNCVVCMEARTDWICKQCTFINEMTREQCKICEESREGKANNKDDNNVKKEEIIDSWYCWYGKCKKRNYGDELYCTHCGLDKSANRERGAAVDMNKYGEKQQVWICYACYHINNDLRGLLCQECFEWKVDGKGESNKDKTNADMNKSCEKLETWTCCKCGNINNALTKSICQMCGVRNVLNRRLMVKVKGFDVKNRMNLFD